MLPTCSLLATRYSLLATDMSHIGTLNERSLHRQLKDLVSEPGDRFEVPLDAYVIDIVRDGALIEIQTGPLGPLGRKLDVLLDEFDVTVVHPISVRTWIHKDDGTSRRSPIRRSIHHVFDDLVSIPTLIDHPRFSLEVLLIEEDTHRTFDPTLRRRRGGWRTTDRAMRTLIERRRFESARELAALIPHSISETFTTADLAAHADIARPVAQKMAYCFRALGVFVAGRRSRSGVEYRLADEYANTDR